VRSAVDGFEEKKIQHPAEADPMQWLRRVPRNARRHPRVAVRPPIRGPESGLPERFATAVPEEHPC
jgi:hypothetical protein